MKNPFLIERRIKAAILEYIADAESDGANENDIVIHIMNEFSLYGLMNREDWKCKIKAIADRLADKGVLQRYYLDLDGDWLAWYFPQYAPPPKWLDMVDWSM